MNDYSKILWNAWDLVKNIRILHLNGFLLMIIVRSTFKVGLFSSIINEHSGSYSIWPTFKSWLIFKELQYVIIDPCLV